MARSQQRYVHAYVPLGCGSRQWRCPEHSAARKGVASGAVPTLSNRIPDARNSVTSGTRRSAAAQPASYLPRRFRKVFLPKISQTNYTVDRPLSTVTELSSFEFISLQLLHPKNA